MTLANYPLLLGIFGNLGTTEILIFLLIVTVLFGSAKLPSLMRNLGRSANEFKKGMRDGVDEEPEARKTDSVS
jgi:sec-independent protein translocase protein TatA